MERIYFMLQVLRLLLVEATQQASTDSLSPYYLHGLHSSTGM